MRSAARQRLGGLYNADDYPPSLQGLFALDWDVPSVEPPDYLMQLSPQFYEQERVRVLGRFEEAVQLAEQAFLGEFSKVVSNLTERLSSGADGERKVFRDTAVTNLVEFFQRCAPGPHPATDRCANRHSTGEPAQSRAKATVRRLEHSFAGEIVQLFAARLREVRRSRGMTQLQLTILRQQAKALFDSVMRTADRETLLMLNPLVARLSEAPTTSR